MSLGEGRQRSLGPSAPQIVSLFVALGLAMINCSPESPTRDFVTPGVPTSTTSEIDLVTFLNVSEHDRSLVLQAIDLSQSYSHGAPGVRVALPVIVEDKPAGLCPPPGTAICNTALTAEHRITIDSLSPGWRNETAALRIKIIAHEYFHVLQEELVQLKVGYFKGPSWLWEGSAEFIADQVVVRAGLVDAQSRYTFHVANSGRVTKSLVDLEIQSALLESGSQGYSLGVLAVELLTRRNGVSSLGAYFDALSSADWPEAFRQAFGTDADSFYREFERYRRSLPSDGHN